MRRRTFLGSLAGTAVVTTGAKAAEPCPPDIWQLHRPARDYLATPARTRGEPANDLALVERLVRSYRRFFRRDDYAGGMWTTFFVERHGKLHDVFMKGSAEDAARILRDPSASDLHYGFDETRIETRDRLSRDRQAAAALASHVKMILVTVAEALGVRKVESSENDRRFPMLPTDELLAAIDAPMGIKVDFPNPFPDEFGLQTGRGVAGERAVQSLYQAFRTRAVAEGMRSPRILEIGGGTGRAAYYCHRMGLTDYTILDLPFSGISQGYFLGRALGPDAIAAEGEAASPRKVKLVSPQHFMAQPARYDLVVNVDGFTEMPLAISRGYWRHFKPASRKFLSMNHEVNEYTVAEITQSKPVIRFPYWLRRGYVEELYVTR